MRTNPLSITSSDMHFHYHEAASACGLKSSMSSIVNSCLSSGSHVVNLAPELQLNFPKIRRSAIIQSTLYRLPLLTRRILAALYDPDYFWNSYKADWRYAAGETPYLVKAYKEKAGAALFTPYAESYAHLIYLIHQKLTHKLTPAETNLYDLIVNDTHSRYKQANEAYCIERNNLCK